MEEEVKEKKGAAGAPKWMTTFADLMSLLMCFFILLLSFSEMDKQKFKKVAGSMENAFGIQRDDRTFGSPDGNVIISTGFDSTPLATRIQESIDEVIVDEKSSGVAELEMLQGAEVRLRIKDSLAFDFGRAEIRKEFLPLLDKLGKIVKEQEAIVTVNGHTDNVPLTKGALFKSNWGLSATRAVNVVEYWTDKFAIPHERLAAAGFADGRPIAGNDTPESRARNRRVEFIFKPRNPGEVFNGLDTIPE